MDVECTFKVTLFFKRVLHKTMKIKKCPYASRVLNWNQIAYVLATLFFRISFDPEY